VPQDTRLCSVDGCARHSDVRGLCHGHYTRWRRFGDVRAHKPLRSRVPEVPCSIGACERPRHTRGWCKNHYLRWYKTGDVQADVPLVERVDRGGITQQGYRVVRAPGHPNAFSDGENIYEHRLVMATTAADSVSRSFCRGRAKLLADMTASFSKEAIHANRF
jgi:hypothetical protein